ncbi:hypothetical protein [Type-D symbiont of Plautia stali]|uniref:hypothetical protein n=1 Tax=Type-D symbiont of Plautia stali TaxID=1560356 RepID=UPI00073E48FA|nr:hypothetical protein [Type-D symbiont of Plautia stali]
MNVIKFPASRKPIDEASLNTHETTIRDVREFALNIASQLRNDRELNNHAPYLVDKVIMLLIKESRQYE